MSAAGSGGPFLALEQALFRMATAPGEDGMSRVLRRAGRGFWTTVHHARHPLSRGRRASAVLNLVAWHVWRRVVRTPVTVELQMGTKLACPSWSKIAGAWVSIGAHEPELFFVADSVREGDVFVDVGANIGVYAVTAALRGARAIAYEPNEQAMAAMRRNAELNGVVQRLTCSTDALSDFDGEASFTTDLECSNQLAADAARGVPVRVSKLDSSLDELRTQSVDLLKIDAEGFDEPVLRGALETLRRHRPTVIVEIWGGGVSVRRLLESAGYRAYSYDYEDRVLRELPPEFAGEGNLVAVHESRIDQTRERLAEARAWLRRGPRLTFRASKSG